MKIPLTIDTIAKASGVNRATVDRVINERSKVHPRTREHIYNVRAHIRKTAGVKACLRR
jgi:DNA-binding LacI/PurR family transcriptional regulator